MDPVTLAYYGLVCGLVSMFAPFVRTRGARFATGIFIGLVAAAFLPSIRQYLGI
ncbi:hypothetical protein [Amaricoccus tamworthensis]|uniref:hypothetical protein n=1 Tax=Amaricoccus tamworthensis TaxID=57002 RepID=UPI003C7DAA66